MKKKISKIIGLCIVVLLVYAGLNTFIFSSVKSEELSYNKFTEKVDKKEIKEVTYLSDDNKIIATDENKNKYKILNPKTDTFREYLLKHEVEVKEPFRISSGTIFNVISAVGTIFLLLVMFSLFKSKDSLIPSTKMNGYKSEKNSDVKLCDIACSSAIKKEMTRLIDFLKRPGYYSDKNAKFPNGILFYGPPGTGKTLLAKAVANEANCSFYALSGSDFVEMYVGRGASRVRELFKEAKKNAPSIIFIDEIDAIGKARGSDSNSERDQTINALLSELDGFSERENILVIAATNKLEDMDSALIRSGRFGKHIKIPLPMTKEERMKIINIHKIKDAYDETVDFDSFAKITRGCSGADISSILNDALLISIGEGKEKVDRECLEKAFNQHIFEGHQDDKKSGMSKEEQTLVAYHEAGHAVVSKLLCGENISTISIIGTTSGAGGYTISTPESDTFFSTKEDLCNEIMKLYAGRAAEKIKGYQSSVGASNDIERATKLLMAMHYEYAMDESEHVLNLRVLDCDKDEKNIKDIKKESVCLYDKTVEFLNKHKELLVEVAETLLEKETIDENEFNLLIAEVDE